MEKHMSNLAVLITLSVCGVCLEALTDKGLSQNILILFCVLGSSFILSGKLKPKKENLKVELKRMEDGFEKRSAELTAQIVANTQYLMQVGEGVSHLIQWVAQSPAKPKRENYAAKIPV